MSEGHFNLALAAVAPLNNYHLGPARDGSAGTVKTSSDLLKQMFRWERSATQPHILTVLEVSHIYDTISWFERRGDGCCVSC
jgi:hypothetical protein